MSTTAVAITLVALIGLAAVTAIGWPLLDTRSLDREQAALDGPVANVELRDELDRTLRAIRELEFDHRAGNLSDADYAELDRIERARAAELIRRRDTAS